MGGWGVGGLGVWGVGRLGGWGGWGFGGLGVWEFGGLGVVWEFGGLGAGTSKKGTLFPNGSGLARIPERQAFVFETLTYPNAWYPKLGGALVFCGDFGWTLCPRFLQLTKR